MDLIEISRQLCKEVSALKFGPPVECVYNPLVYAREPHEEYLRKWGGGRREVVLVGMNPGPWGMAQTGVPFGEVHLARHWLGIEGAVGKPERQHPKRPIEGFECRRSEVSGARLWGWAKDCCGTPERFFARFFVYNYCPLCFMESSGRNRTPDKLPAREKQPLFEACDRALRRVGLLMRPQFVVGVGRFAEERARDALEALDVMVCRILHPSPASPLANRGWAEAAHRDLSRCGVLMG